MIKKFIGMIMVMAMVGAFLTGCGVEAERSFEQQRESVKVIESETKEVLKLRCVQALKEQGTDVNVSDSFVRLISSELQFCAKISDGVAIYKINAVDYSFIGDEIIPALMGDLQTCVETLASSSTIFKVEGDEIFIDYMSSKEKQFVEEVKKDTSPESELNLLVEKKALEALPRQITVHRARVLCDDKSAYLVVLGEYAKGYPEIFKYWIRETDIIEALKAGNDDPDVYLKVSKGFVEQDKALFTKN